MLGDTALGKVDRPSSLILTPTHRLILAGVVLVCALYATLTVTVGWTTFDIDRAAGFWSAILVGVVGWSISSFVWALNPRELPSILFMLSGLCTLAFSMAGAPQGDAAPAASHFIMMVNAMGASCFGITMIALFTVYPRRLQGWRLACILQALFFSLWSIASVGGLVQHPWFTVSHVTMVEMLVIIGVAFIQFVTVKKDPQARAIALWLGGSVLIGAGSFIATVAAPIVLGYAPLVRFEYALGFFLIIYFGVGLGLRRYRLFALNEWAYQFAIYALAALLVLALDAFFVYVLSVREGQAIGMSLLLAVFAYLPFRDRIAGVLFGRRKYGNAELLEGVIGIAFSASAQIRSERWQETLQRLFDPLEITLLKQAPGSPTVLEEGGVMLLPSVGSLPGIRLRYPFRGRGLFGPRHLQLAEQVVSLLRQADEGREAYRLGVMAERNRISRDMHDNIGAQLLSALHHSDAQRKDAVIRASLSDLRAIVNDVSRPELSFVEGIADLRTEAMDRLSIADIELDWQATVDDFPALPAREAHAFRSIVREALSNIIKHSGAHKAFVAIGHDGDMLTLFISDDGVGATENRGHGNGLSNMASRVTALGGTLRFPKVARGFALEFSFPHPGEIAS